MLPPDVLREEEFRFCKVIHKGKRAFEKKFNTPEVAYQYHSCDLFGKWLMDSKGNYGVLCGYGGLFVLDFDDLATFEKVKKALPPTMMVKSAGKNLPHLYYKDPNAKKISKVLFDDADGNRIIDLQGQGTYVVGPGSVAPNKEGVMKEYRLVNKLPITNTSYLDICSTLDSLLGSTNTKVSKKMPFKAKRIAHTGDERKDKIKNYISMPQLLAHYGSNVYIKRTSCPFGHSSTSGKNVQFDNDLMYCHHCCQGGDIFKVVRIAEQCSFPESMEYLEKEFNIK